MNKSKVELVESEGFTINFPSVGAPMATRAEGDEVVVVMRFTFRPRDNVMDIDLDVSASVDGTTVPSLDEDAPTDFSRYWRAPVVSHPKSPQDATGSLSHEAHP